MIHRNHSLAVTPVFVGGAQLLKRRSALQWFIPLAVIFIVLGCASSPSPPQWHLRASSALDQFTQRSLLGDQRGAESEFNRAADALSRTGNPGRVAQAELIRCAVRMAGLDMDDCPKFRQLQSHADPADSAYARYLMPQSSEQLPAELLQPLQGSERSDSAARRLTDPEISLLPAHHQPVARFLARASLAPSDDQSAVVILRAVNDPLARLIAAAVTLRAGQAGPEVVALAVQTASDQGWRRPLIAWLKVQYRLAQASGDQAFITLVATRLRIAQGDLSSQ